jgi:hypothetical protein
MVFGDKVLRSASGSKKSEGFDGEKSRSFIMYTHR